MITYTKQLNLYLAIRVLLKKRADRLPADGPKKVVILFLTHNIGDMIFATPVFHALKTAYPKTHLTVIGSLKNKIMTEGNPDIDVYEVCPDSLDDLIKVIKNIGADYGFSLSTSTVDIASLILARVPAVAAFKVENAHNETLSYKAVLKRAIRVPFYIGKYYASEYLRILEPIGVKSVNLQKRLYYTSYGKEKVEAFLKGESVVSGQKIAVFSPGAGTKVKQWPAERFAAVADHVSQKFSMRVAVIGGPGDRVETDAFIRHLKIAKPLICTELSLDELKAFIARTHLLVANDSGPVYIAEAFNVPTLVVVGPTDENEHPPRGERNRIVTASERGTPELRGHLEGFNVREAREQIESVGVNQVVEEIDSLIYTIQNG